MTYYRTIPVTERLPDMGKKVITICSDGTLDKNYIQSNGTWEYHYGNFPIVSWLEALPPDEFVNGEEVEVSSDSKTWYNRQYFIGKTKLKRYATQDLNSDIVTWQYCRRPQSEFDIQKDIDGLIAKAKQAGKEIIVTIK